MSGRLRKLCRCQLRSAGNSYRLLVWAATVWLSLNVSALAQYAGQCPDPQPTGCLKKRAGQTGQVLRGLGPGHGAVLVARNGETLFEKAYGYANLRVEHSKHREYQIPYRIDHEAVHVSKYLPPVGARSLENRGSGTSISARGDTSIMGRHRNFPIVDPHCRSSVGIRRMTSDHKPKIVEVRPWIGYSGPGH
jgi:hypothetical protein